MSEPVYRVVAEEIRDRIRKGELRPGQIIESRNELRRRMGIGSNTVQAAIALLEEEGFVKSYIPQGTFVTGAEPEFPVAPYEVVVNDIAREIETGLLRPGDMLLKETELAELYGCSQGTISRAVGELERRGLVRAEVSIGTYVADDAPRDTRPKHVIARERLMQDIKAGVFPVGSRLPSRGALAVRYGVGINAITRVQYAFRDQGIVHMSSGRPVVVAKKPR